MEKCDSVLRRHLLYATCSVCSCLYITQLVSNRLILCLGGAFLRGSCKCKFERGCVKTRGFPLSSEKDIKNGSGILTLVKKEECCARRVTALCISSLPSLPICPRTPSPVLGAPCPEWGLRSSGQRTTTSTLNRSRWE